MTWALVTKYRNTHTHTHTHARTHRSAGIVGTHVNTVQPIRLELEEKVLWHFSSTKVCFEAAI